MKKIVSLIFALVSFTALSQLPDLEVQEVRVSDSSRRNLDRVLTIRRAQILELQPEDVGQLLQKMAGIQIKSYGGLGGLKTISIRSLGGQHTSCVVDGFSILNSQTGQVNLGAIQAENIETIQAITGAQKNVHIPVSAHASGSILLIETFENSFSPEKHQLRFSSKFGSFGQYDTYLSYKFRLRKLYLSVFGKYRYADGTYAFSLQNGQNSYTGTRANNRYEEASAGISLGGKLTKNGTFTFQFRSETSDQELPGAVILYSNNSFQTLKIQSHRAQMAYLHQFKKLMLRFYAAGNLGEMLYHDPNYFNSAGEIHASYTTKNLQIGTNGNYRLTENLDIFGGTEQQISSLETTVSGIGKPVRFAHFSLLGFSYSFAKFQLTSQLNSQLVQDQNSFGFQKNRAALNPFIQLETNELFRKKRLKLIAFYRNSLRMPTFNELYYSSIGNNFLRPEQANQFSLGMQFTPKTKKSAVLARTNAYFNQVEDKIVAIPTKNLFIWSMQNIGKVAIFGTEASIDANYSFNEKWSCASLLNYTLQLALDVTDRQSPTYGDQIAYIPMHSYNADISLKRNKIGFRWSIYGNSLRYSLNENTLSNQVAGFILHDLAVFGSFTLKNQTFRWQFSCKNSFNSSYAIVRYYVMPGRNYLISLNYALH